MLIDRKPFHDPSELLIFLHLPKTAGVSMHDMLQSVFGEKYFRHSQTLGTLLSELGQNERSRLQCISGHFKFGVHRQFKQNSVYFTVVRDPVERVVSLYNHKRRRGKLLKQYGRNPEIDEWLGDFLRGDEGKPYTQCEAICGSNCFEEARKCLVQNYLLYGSLGQLDDLTGVLQEYLGKPNLPPLKRLNTYPDSQEKSIPSSAMVEILQGHYSQDFSLVSFCEAEFSSRFC